MTFQELTVLSDKQLEQFMPGHPAPTATQLMGFDCRGWNIEAGTKILGIRKFFKGFFGMTPEAWGYNMPTPGSPGRCVIANRVSENLD